MRKGLLITSLCILGACGTQDPHHYAVITSTLQENSFGDFYRDYDILEDRLTEQECLRLVETHKLSMALFASTRFVADMGCYHVGPH